MLGQETEAVVEGYRTVLLADPTLGTLTETYYWLRYANGKPVQGRTDARGRFHVRTDWGDFVDVAIQARVKTRGIRVMLTKASVATPNGAWARLVNLGYVGVFEPPVEPSPEQLREALARYQVVQGLRRTGTLDGETQAHLETDGRTAY